MAIYNRSESPIIEACVESVAEALSCARNGADRLELCSALDQDGLTPHKTLLTEVLNQVSIPVKVMIRPRPGDFHYDHKDQEDIVRDILMCKSLGVSEFVYGSLKDNRIDMTDLEAFVQHARPSTLTIHKAIDVSSDPLRDLFMIMRWAEKQTFPVSILSSGQAPTAIAGALRLRRMIQLAADKVEIIVAGKVTHDNLTTIQTLIPAPAYHGRRICISE